MNKKKSILIVDDDESIYRNLALILGKKGYETEIAGTGREAREKAQGRFFNLALPDFKLPDDNLFFCAGQIDRSRTPNPSTKP